MELVSYNRAVTDEQVERVLSLTIYAFRPSPFSNTNTIDHKKERYFIICPFCSPIKIR